MRGVLLPLLLVIVSDALQLRRTPVLRLSGGSAPSEWSAHTTDDGRVYYYDSVSGTSMWTPPPELAPDGDHGAPENPAAGAPELPEGWSAHTTPDDGRTYYFHQPSGQSSWEFPIAESVAGAQFAADEEPLEEARSVEEAVKSSSPESDLAGAAWSSEDTATVDVAALLAARARSYAPEGGASQEAESQQILGAEASEMADTADTAEAAGEAEKAEAPGGRAGTRGKPAAVADGLAPGATRRRRGWWWLCCGSSEEARSQASHRASRLHTVPPGFTPCPTACTAGPTQANHKLPVAGSGQALLPNAARA